MLKTSAASLSVAPALILPFAARPAVAIGHARHYGPDLLQMGGGGDDGDGGGDGGGDQGGGDGKGGAGDGGGDQGGGDGKGGDKQERFITGPDGQKIAIPVNLWDPKANDGKGGPNVAAILKSQSDLRQRLGAVPGKYEVKLAGDLAEKYEIAAEDPFAVKAVEIISKHKGVMSQAAFEELTTAFAEREIARESEGAAKEVERLQNDHKVLEEAWGQNAASNTKALDGWLNQMFKGKAGALEEVRLMRASADGTMALFTLFEAAKGKGLAKPGGGGGAAEILTEAELEAIQKSDAYQNPNHKDYAATRKKVSEGYKRLYPDD
ncbi:hypothetical protein [Ferrovibrio terrae]|uniref:hypothetical protein n=1 Tax=Ferrovibrio terrae TaxID=2594003 RepID=UPI003137D27D